MVQLSFLSQVDQRERVTGIPHVPCWYAADLSVTNDISFHARVGRFSPFLYLRSVALLYLWSVAIAVILFWLQLVVLVSPCFLGSRIPRDYRFPRAPIPL